MKNPRPREVKELTLRQTARKEEPGFKSRHLGSRVLPSSPVIGSKRDSRIG